MSLTIERRLSGDDKHECGYCDTNLEVWEGWWYETIDREPIVFCSEECYIKSDLPVIPDSLWMKPDNL